MQLEQRLAEQRVEESLLYLTPKFGIDAKNIPRPVVKIGDSASYDIKASIITISLSPEYKWPLGYSHGEEVGHHIHCHVNPEIRRRLDPSLDLGDFIRISNLAEMVGCYAGLIYAQSKGEDTQKICSGLRKMQKVMYAHGDIYEKAAENPEVIGIEGYIFLNEQLQHSVGDEIAIFVFENFGDKLLSKLARAKSLQEALQIIESASK